MAEQDKPRLHFVRFYAEYYRLVGDFGAALVLEEAIFQSRQTPDGWFTLTHKQWESRLAISRRYLDRARRFLRRHPAVWQECLKGAPSRLFYRADEVALFKELAGFKDVVVSNVEGSLGRELHRLAPDANLDRREAPTLLGAGRQPRSAPDANLSLLSNQTSKTDRSSSSVFNSGKKRTTTTTTKKALKTTNAEKFLRANVPALAHADSHILRQIVDAVRAHESRASNFAIAYACQQKIKEGNIRRNAPAFLLKAVPGYFEGAGWEDTERKAIREFVQSEAEYQAILELVKSNGHMRAH